MAFEINIARSAVNKSKTKHLKVGWIPDVNVVETE